MRAFRLGVIGLAFIAVSGEAAVRDEAGSPYARYMRARAADAAGHTEAAAKAYAAVLAETPGDVALMQRTYRQAMAAGDRMLATRTARMLDTAKALPADGRLLLLADAVLAGNWAAARTTVDQVQVESVYGFAVPVMRAWIAFSDKSGKGGDPLAALDTARQGGAIAIAYATEHRALLLLAMGRTAEGVAAIQAQTGGLGGRAVRLRLAAASLLAKTDRPAALALLAGDDSTLAAARRLISAGRPLPGGIDGAAPGLAELFARIAIDINRERVTPVSLTLARLGTFLAPGNAETWLVASEILSAADQYDSALAAAAQVKADDPFAEAARFTRIQLLVRQGATDRALTEALAIAKAPGATADDWVRVGQIQTQLERHADAADSFGRGLALVGQGRDRWSLLLQRGGALDRAGDWPAAKMLLEEAVRLAPDQASALNYLGYAQLERRINLPQAEQLIERASRLRPDDAAITDSLGWTYFLRGDVPKAIATLENAVVAEPAEPTINEHLADAYWKVGRRLEARYAWRAALVFAEARDQARIRSKIDTGWSPAVAAP